ncbi:FadR family transcriptional regulator [Ktedonosporobacter rubrisoli]|uniref:FadR family transcriptional regulator n=1 Tax=Ktedonosporobacter rubrisoli TaxID=2509675 RepID=A0A4P6JQW1_KTERU|nr:FCD domain-containing protein [Ktedonosporobacter rubrisoli]QBD77694.1 FadR family transcriptional regulator [Ktedonosporobacter rubrisoli]
MVSASQKPRSRPLQYQRVIDTLKARIQSGEWQPGQRLPTVVDLSSELGVGLSSVREAIRILGSEQLLRIEQGRGIFVSDAPRLPPGLFDNVGLHAETTLAALFEARRIIEPGLAALAAQRATAEDITIIHAAAQQMAVLAQEKRDYSEPDLLLHRQIALAANNPFMSKVMEMVLDLVAESRLLTMRLPNMPGRSSQYHMLIAEAIKEHDPSRAEALMRAHLDDQIAELQRVEIERRQPTR